MKKNWRNSLKTWMQINLDLLLRIKLSCSSKTSMLPKFTKYSKFWKRMGWKKEKFQLPKTKTITTVGQWSMTMHLGRKLMIYGRKTD